MNKMVFLIYDAAIDAKIEQLLHNLGIDGYTKWQTVDGYGGREKRFGNKVWPGMNSLRLIVDEDQKIQSLVKELKELRAGSIKPPVLKLFKVPVEQIEL